MSESFRLVPFVILFTALSGFAQQSGREPFLKQFVHEEWKIWSSPARVHRNDLNWITSLSVTSAILIHSDREISEEGRETDDWTRPSHVISSFGSSIPMLAA